MSIFCLVYMSQATAGFEERSLIDLVEQSKAKNGKKTITGMLLFNEGYFLQMLEGDEFAVRQLMEVIRQDSRHDQVRVLFAQQMAHRHCPNWSMLLLDSPASTNELVRQKMTSLATISQHPASDEDQRDIVISDLFCRFMSPAQLQDYIK